MSDLASTRPRTLPLLSTYSAVGPGMLGAAPTSAGWLAANRAIFTPLVLPSPVIVDGLGVIVGGTSSGNVDIGLYTEDGVRLVSTGSTAQGAINTDQLITVADTLAGPGVLYVGVACDVTTATLMHFNPGASHLVELWGAEQMSAAFPLPATWVKEALASSRFPIWLLRCREGVR
jgi:hypothetical protein